MLVHGCVLKISPSMTQGIVRSAITNTIKILTPALLYFLLSTTADSVVKAQAHDLPEITNYLILTESECKW